MHEPGYSVLQPETFSSRTLAREAFALDVLMGLSAQRRFIPSRYFYDDRGSELFGQIMDLPEYYPTRCETEILRDHGRAMVALVPSGGLQVVELGAGDGRKTQILLEELRRAGRPLRYQPVDISEAAIAGVTRAMSERFPGLSCAGVVAEYFDALRWINREVIGRKLVLFLGSNIGNFDGPRAQVFLRTLWNALSDGDLALIGFDLKKDIDVMLRAYNDPRGLTAAFNLNVLERINRELGGDFDPRKFRHYGTYDVFSGAMESYLVSREAQRVTIAALSKSYDFAPFEPIHLEYSFKFLREQAVGLARATGFRELATFSDERGYFIDSLWRVEKRLPA